MAALRGGARSLDCFEVKLTATGRDRETPTNYGQETESEPSRDVHLRQPLDQILPLLFQLLILGEYT